MEYYAEVLLRINYVGALPEHVNLKTNVIVTSILKTTIFVFLIVTECVWTILVQAKHGINNIKLISLIILVLQLARLEKNNINNDNFE